MSTAILIVYTPDGFVVAADRRKTRPDGTVVSDSIQKIFAFKGQPVAYGLAGTVQFTRGDTEAIHFDFVCRTRAAVDAVSDRDPFSLKKHVRLSCAQINAELANAKSSGLIETYPDSVEGTKPTEDGGQTIAQALFFGYYKGTPEFICGRFGHHSQQLRPPDVRPVPIALGVLQGYGSFAILQKFSDGTDPLFTKYVSHVAPNAIGIPEAIDLINNYFRACSDPAIRALDEAHCNSLSPKINIATITTRTGFAWVPGYEPF